MAAFDALALNHARRSFATLHPEQRVEDALLSIRAQELDSAIVYFYVVDDHRQLRGVVPTRRLLTASPDALISQLMTDATVTLPLEGTLGDAAATLVDHRLLAVPIVSKSGRIQAVIDASALGADVTADITGRGRHELFQLLGIRMADASGRFRGRMSALTWNIVGGLIAAFVAAAFDDLLRNVAALALFMPVTLALSESIGMQAVAVASHARKEVGVAGRLALTAGSIVAVVALLWIRQWQFALTVLIAISVAMTIAAIIGAVVPRLLRLLKWNPTVAAGPAVLALADFVCLIVYFSVATALLDR